MKGGVINASPGQEAKYLMRGHAISILWEGVHTNKQSNCQHVINRAPVIPVRPVAPPVQPVQPVAPSLTPAGPTPAPVFPQPVSPAGPVIGGFNNLAGAPPGSGYQYFHQSTPNPYYPSVTPTPFHAPVTPAP